MQHAPAVRVGDRVADRDEPIQEMPALKVLAAPAVVPGRLDRLAKRMTPDELHGVIRAAVGILAQPVNRDNAGMFQTAGDLGLDQEPGPAVGSMRVSRLDFLQSDLAAELLVERDEDVADPAPCMEPDRLVAERLIREGGRLAVNRGLLAPAHPDLGTGGVDRAGGRVVRGAVNLGRRP